MTVRVVVTCEGIQRGPVGERSHKTWCLEAATAGERLKTEVESNRGSFRFAFYSNLNSILSLG